MSSNQIFQLNLKIIPRIWKFFYRMMVVIIALVLLLLLLVQLPPVQNMIAQKVVSSLNEELNASISVDRMYISFLNRVKVRGLVITDQEQDTVISATEINIGLKLFPLVQNEVRLSRVQMEDPRLHLVKNEQDSLMNIVTMFRQQAQAKTDTSPATLPDISLGQLRINSLDFSLDNRMEGSMLTLDMGQLVLRPEMLNLREQRVQVSELSISDLYMEMLNPAGDTVDPPPETRNPVAQSDPLALIPWSIDVDQLRLNNNNIDIREHTPAKQSGVQTFIVQQLDTELSGIRMDQDGYAAEIDALEATLNKNLHIRDLRLAAAIDDRSAVLSGGRIRIRDSRIFLDATLNYASARMLAADPGNTAVQLDLRTEARSKDLSDILKSDWPLTSYPTLRLDANIAGTLDSLQIDSINGSAGEAIRLRISGALNKILHPDQLSGSLDLEELSIFRDALYGLVPDTVLPAQISFPDEVSLTGNLSGNRLQVTSDLSLLTTFGSVYAQVDATADTTIPRENIRMNIYTESFDLGALLNMQDTIGQFVFAGQVQGETSGFKNPSLEADLDIGKAEVFEYAYSDLSISGNYSNELIYLQSSMDDPNSSFIITGEYHFNDSVPDIFLEGDFRQLRLQPLNFADSRSDLELKVSAGLHGLNPETMLGNLKVYELGYHSESSKYWLDSLKLFFDGGTNYRMLLDNLFVDDTLYAHEFELFSERKEQTMDLAYSGRFENIPGTREGLIRLDGDGTLLMLPDSLVLGSNLHISNSSVPDTSGYRIDFSRILSDKDRSSYELYLSGNDLHLTGSALLETTGEVQMIDGQARVDSLNLGLLQPFLADALKSVSGVVSADMAVKGPVAEPALNGSVTFKNTRFNPTALNTSFTLQEETVALNNQQVSFDSLTLLDARKNRAVLDGTVNLRKETENNLQLSLMAREFQLVNKSAAEGDLYYGNVVADLDGNVTGTFANPLIQLNSAFRKESDFSFILPGGKTPTGEGVIKFVDAEPQDSQLIDSISKIDTIKASPTNVEITASASFTDRFTLTIITNPLAGERLQIRGNGDLGFSLDRSGAMSLIGEYEITEGNYNLQLFDLIKREFYIQPGSYLNWSGEILEATADIAAVYEVNTSLEELMQYQQGSASEGTYGSADFEVVMRLTGPLLTPEIEFDIRSKEQGAAISAALSGLRNNESELNKQVFSLLVFNRFMGESAAASDPLSYEFSNQSRQSLSSLLSKQLDRFADQYIDKVDLDIEIDSYETGMESDVAARTDVSMDLSTNVFNDRLTLEVGGSVAVEEPGTQGGNLEAGDLAGDFRVEYKLSKDGVYRVNVFNKTDYENEIDGEVTKTGVSFIFNKNFSTFSELFGRKKEGGPDED